MAPGASFEYGQHFTVNIWPLKPQMAFSSVISLLHMHISPKDMDCRWQIAFGIVFIQIFPSALSPVQNLFCNLFSK